MNTKVLLIVFFIAINQFAYSQTYNIELSISNINKLKGEVLIAVYNIEETFLNRKKSYKEYKKEVKSESMLFVIKDIPQGEYSIAIFHDEDSNGRLKRNFLGIPSEDFGFSNINSMIFSQPSYEETKFYLKSDTSFIIPLQ